jgi:translation elongation factor EF-G
MKAMVWRDESSAPQWDVVEIPADLKDKAEEYRELLIETAVEADEAAMEAYLEGEMPDNDEIRALVRKGTSRGVLPDVLRLCLQEQGCSAAARRCGRVPAEPARRSCDQGHRPGDEKKRQPASRRR